MIKITHANQGRGPLSKKLLAGIGKAQARKVVDLSQFREARLDAENLDKTDIKDTVTAYEMFMKYGLSRQQMKYRRSGMHYWNEYVFEGYVNHQDSMIILAGYPDIPLSRPHSEESQELRGGI